MAASDPDIRVADDAEIDLVACQTDEGDIVFYDPTPGADTVAGGRWICANPDDCVDLGEST